MKKWFLLILLLGCARSSWATTYYFGSSGGAPTTLSGWFGSMVAFASGNLNGTVATQGYPFTSLKSPVDPVASFSAVHDAKGTGPWNGITPDGSYNSADATCGVAGKCFVSASGAFSAGDIGKVISIDLLGTAILPCGNQCTTGVVQPFTTTIAAITSGTEVQLTATPIQTGSHTSLSWMAGTNNCTPFKNAINNASGNSVKVPTGYYLFANTPIGAPGDNSSCAQVTATHETIQGQPGSVLLHAFSTGGINHIYPMFYVQTVNDINFVGLTWYGTNWRKALNIANGAGYSNLVSEFEGFVWTTSSQVGFIANTMKWSWGQYMIEIFGTPTTSSTHAIGNIFVDSGLNGIIGDGSSNNVWAYNYSEDARMNEELDSCQPTQTATNNDLHDNYAKWVDSPGGEWGGGTPCNGNGCFAIAEDIKDCPAPAYSTDHVYNNVCDGPHCHIGCDTNCANAAVYSHNAWINTATGPPCGS